MAQNVTFISKNDKNDDFSLRHSPFVNSFGADFLHFTIFAVLQNDEMLAWAGRAGAQTMNCRFPFFVLIFGLNRQKVQHASAWTLDACTDVVGAWGKGF